MIFLLLLFLLLLDGTNTLRLCPPPTGSLSRQRLRVGPNIVPTNFEPLSRIHRRHSASDDRLVSDKVMVLFCVKIQFIFKIYINSFNFKKTKFGNYNFSYIKQCNYHPSIM